ncbi:hypothetical protein Aduo_000628 [Ancylostoma duodenale]
MAEEKNIIIMLYRYDVPRINIFYKDRKDLFRTFKKELKKHHLSIGEVSWGDYDNWDRSVIRNADDLFGAVAGGSVARMYCRPKDGHLLFTPSNSDDDEEMDCACGTSCRKTFEAAKSTEKTNRASMKLIRDNLPRIILNYKDKKDLFKQFQEKIKALNLPKGEVYWGDVWEDERIVIENADDLFEFVENNTIVKMYYRRTDHKKLLARCSSDEDEKKNMEKNVTKKNQFRTRSQSPSRRQHRSRSALSRSHSHSSWNQLPWNFAPWNLMMDPCFFPDTFLRCPHPSGNKRRRRHERN